MKQARANTPKAEVKTFPLRIDSEVYEALKADAKKRRRSANAQINLLIEQHLEKAA